MMRAPIAGLLIAIAEANLTQAAEICLTPTRIFSWSAVDDRTLIIMDRDRKQYAVKLGGICTGLENPKFAIAIVTPTRLSCVGPGDRVRFGDPTFGPQSCPVSSISAYTPPAEPK